MAITLSICSSLEKLKLLQFAGNEAYAQVIFFLIDCHCGDNGGIFSGIGYNDKSYQHKSHPFFLKNSV